MVDLEGLYGQSFDRLRTLASRYVRWQDSEDVVQDAFVRAHEHSRTFEGRAAPGTWLHRIVANAAIDAGRLAARRLRREERAASVASRASGGSAEVRLAVESALAGLSPQDREICLLYDVVGYSHREIASRLGIAIGTSKSRLSHARRRLRSRLSGDRHACHD